MRKVICLVLLAVALVGCGSDTETSVLANPASTAKYTDLGVALMALGGTFGDGLIHPIPVKIADTPTDGFLITFNGLSVNTSSGGPYFSGAWTDTEKAKFTSLYDGVALTR